MTEPREFNACTLAFVNGALHIGVQGQVAPIVVYVTPHIAELAILELCKYAGITFDPREVPFA